MKTVKIALLLLAAVFVLPVVLTAVSAFMSPEEAVRRFGGQASEWGQGVGATLIPDFVSLKQLYALCVETEQYFAMFWNSVLFSLVITASVNLIAVPVAFGLSKTRFRFSGLLFLLYILTMMMPFSVTMLPNYIMLSRLNMLDTVWAVILPSCFAPFGCFLLRQFMLGVDDALIESALLETNSYVRLMRHIVLPSVKPGLVAMNILVFAEAWNMVELPKLFLKEQTAQPLSVTLNGLIAQDISVSFAGSLLYLSPIILLYIIFSKETVSGLEKYRW